jgi:hypothetical protein
LTGRLVLQNIMRLANFKERIMATMKKMLAVAPLSEGEVVAMVKLEPFEIAIIGYAAKKKVSLVSRIEGQNWMVTLNGFNTTRFDLEKIGQEVEIQKVVGKETVKEKKVVTLENFIENLKEMINIIKSKPKQKSKPKIKHMGDCKPLKVGKMAEKCEKRFVRLPYVGMWDTGQPGVQVGAKVLGYKVVKCKNVPVMQEGYFVNGIYCGQDFARAVRAVGYYQEYTR